MSGTDCQSWYGGGFSEFGSDCEVEDMAEGGLPEGGAYIGGK